MPRNIEIVTSANRERLQQIRMPVELLPEDDLSYEPPRTRGPVQQATAQEDTLDSCTQLKRRLEQNEVASTHVVELPSEREFSSPQTHTEEEFYHREIVLPSHQFDYQGANTVSEVQAYSEAPPPYQAKESNKSTFSSRMRGWFKTIKNKNPLKKKDKSKSSTSEAPVSIEGCEISMQSSNPTSMTDSEISQNEPEPPSNEPDVIRSINYSLTPVDTHISTSNRHEPSQRVNDDRQNGPSTECTSMYDDIAHHYLDK